MMDWKHPLRLWPRSCGALVMVIVLGLTGTARAQFGEAAGIAESMQQEYFNRDVTLIVEGLELDETQRIIVEELYKDYQADFDAGVDRMKNRFMAMKDELAMGDPERVVRVVFAPWEDWNSERRQLGDRFIDNIKVVLTPQQLDAWPTFERRLYREKTLHKGTLSGESLNLFHVVRDMDLEPPIRVIIQPALDEYDFALDQVLRRRDGVAREGQTTMIRSLQEGNAELSLDILERQLVAHVAVRDVNESFISVIAEAMPSEELREEFRSDALERAYPRIYRRLPVLRLFDAALELPDLDPAVRDQIEGLLDGFYAEVEPLNDALLRALKDHEPATARRRAQLSAARMKGESPSSIPTPSPPNFHRRNILSRQYARLLQDVLTEEQFESLPGSARWLAPPPEPPSKGDSGKVVPKSMRNSKGAPPDSLRDARKGDLGDKGSLNRVGSGRAPRPK